MRDKARQSGANATAKLTVYWTKVHHFYQTQSHRLIGGVKAYIQVAIFPSVV